MEITLNKPYLISWLAIPTLILTGLIVSQHTVDIQLHDTYYVIANLHVALAGSLLFLLIGAGYWLIIRLGKSPNRVLTAVHLLVTVGVLLLFMIPISADRIGVGTLLGWSATALLVAQLFYVINISISLIRT